MSIATHVVVRANGSPNDLRAAAAAAAAAAAPAPSATRPRDLVRLPALPAPEGPVTTPDEEPVTAKEGSRRAPGAHCRIAMGYLD